MDQALWTYCSLAVGKRGGTCFDATHRVWFLSDGVSPNWHGMRFDQMRDGCQINGVSWKCKNSLTSSVSADPM